MYLQIGLLYGRVSKYEHQLICRWLSQNQLTVGKSLTSKLVSCSQVKVQNTLGFNNGLISEENKTKIVVGVIKENHQGVTGNGGGQDLAPGSIGTPSVVS